MKLYLFLNRDAITSTNRMWDVWRVLIQEEMVADTEVVLQLCCGLNVDPKIRGSGLKKDNEDYTKDTWHFLAWQHATITCPPEPEEPEEPEEAEVAEDRLLPICLFHLTFQHTWLLLVAVSLCPYCPCVKSKHDKSHWFPKSQQCSSSILCSHVKSINFRKLNIEAQSLVHKAAHI